MIFLQLFWEFFKTGLFAVGGGMATLPFLYDMSDKMGWFTHAQLADMIAVSESTPGPIGVNMATYVGFSTAGVLGALCSTIGIVTPAVIIILIVSKALEKFRQNKYVDAAFYALRPCSVALIASAGFLVLKIALFNFDTFTAGDAIISVFNWKAIALAAVILLLTRYVKKTKDLHPIVFIVLSALVGIVFSF